MSKMSTTARDELVGALARRYAVGTRAEKTRILDEFEAVTGFHRKHAMRVLRSCATRRRAEGRAGRRIYDDAVRDALVVLWEASDRICGKRLKALMPTLVEAMERHGHPRLGPEIRAGLLAMSAATIDRSLRKVRERAGGRSRRRAAPPSSVRRSIPVRTFSDWDDPAPGFAEADLVAHSGPVTRGSFVQTLVVTDIATGWTECAPVLYREQTLLREVLGEVRRLMPFDLLGFDTDNDSVFINETLRDYCRDGGIVFTRCRPWRKNDQAFVEQKNGAVVRRIVGYRAWRAWRPLRRCPGCTRRRGCTSTSSNHRSSWHPSGVTARASASATTHRRPRASGCWRTRGRLPPCANASPNCRRRSIRSGCFGRCGRNSSASWTSPISRSRNRRTRRSRRSSSSSPACGRPGRKVRRDRRRSLPQSRSASGGVRIRWSGSRNSCTLGSKPSRGAPAASCSSASGRVPGRPPAHGAAAGEGLAREKATAMVFGELQAVESVADVK